MERYDDPDMAVLPAFTQESRYTAHERHAAGAHDGLVRLPVWHLDPDRGYGLCGLHRARRAFAMCRTMRFHDICHDLPRSAYRHGRAIVHLADPSLFLSSRACAGSTDPQSDHLCDRADRRCHPGVLSGL